MQYPFEFADPTSITSLAGLTSVSLSPIAGNAFVESLSSKAAIPLGDLLRSEWSWEVFTFSSLHYFVASEPPVFFDRLGAFPRA